MTGVKIYGIKNCDTMKKAFRWLEDRGIAYSFHDYKKDGVDMDILAQAIAAHGWENIINRRGTTWRKLPDEIRENMNVQKAMEIAADNPAIIKRPLLLTNGRIHPGFNEERYQAILE